MECIICERKFEKNILFEDDKIIISLAVEPSVNGHIQIFSKEHYTIMEQAPDDVLNKMVSAANKMSMILFESMKVHGTNIIINNGVPAGQKIPHFAIDILPRRTDDNLKLDWTLKQATPEALDSIHRIIEEGLNIPGHNKLLVEDDKPKDAVNEENRQESDRDEPDDSEESAEEKKQTIITNYSREYHK